MAIYDKLCILLNPLIIGASIALVMNVPLRGCEKLFEKLDRKKRMSPKVRNACSLTLAFILTPLVIIGIIAFFVPQFVSAVGNLISIVRSNSDDIIAFTSRFGLGSEMVTQKIEEATEWISSNLSNIAGVTVSTLISIVNSMTSGIMSIMLAIYLLISKQSIARQSERLLRAVLPRRFSDFITRVFTMFVEAFSRFLSRQCLEAVILGLILLAGMTIFSIPYAMSVCSLSIVLALIPYIGAFLSLALGALMIVLVSPSKALVFIIIFEVVQQIEENVIYPRVVGESVGLPAYITLLAVAVGGEMMGIAGMLLFVPIASVVYTLAREFVNHRLAE